MKNPHTWSSQVMSPAFTGLVARRATLTSLHARLFRGGLVFKAHRLCISLNSRLASDTEEEEKNLPANHHVNTTLMVSYL